MALQTLNTIKQWFKTGLKPTQTQFWDTWDSFRHKYEKVPVKDIEGIDELLLSKADKTVLDNHLADKNAHAPQVNTDWNSESGLSQLLNKPEFKTINGEPIIGNGDIILDVEGLTFDQVLSNGNETTHTALFKSYADNDVYTNTINAQNIEMTQSSTVTRGENKIASLNLSSELIDFVNSKTGETTALFAQGIGFGNLNSNRFSTLGMNPDTTVNYSNVLMPAITTEEETKTLATLDDIPAFLPVSATQSGIVDNTPLQELGGADKLINGIRIGKGNNSTVATNTVLGSNALMNATTSIQNTAIGRSVLALNTTGSYNTGVGSVTLANLTTGTQNVGIGGAALRYLTTGSYNLAIGTNALVNNLTGTGNVAVGTAAAAGALGSYNTSLGWLSGSSSTITGTGDNNITIGFQSGYNLTTGAGNVLIGTPFSNADLNYSTGSNNISINTGQRNNGITTGSGNTIIGGVQGLNQNDANLAIFANGVGDIAIRKEADNRLLAPTLTNTIIDSGGNKSLITKEYLEEKTQIKDKQIIINGDIDIQENWNGQTIIFKSSGVVRMPIINTEEFSFNAITLEGVNLTWQWANQIEWVFGEPEITPEKKYLNLTKLGNTNQIILSV
ncbi:hypothetical protein FLA105534_03470 [Flavobacterium bizetiae]|uniref:Peptidase S74 domain-containing protein n=1 Tax=Flavobacterium bizetiae TaxID=2704140 RepID=A0A6J4GPP3_9FLAO|nr:hypothetical protein [Flavobacterium bizetiae]CAA9201218.1 hypothetical protein FLA105534_03470 [Flavobacterium bizetiae]CAD5346886.1 hypothetical protein FLA105534_00829 [Flavobacterium bizetiae]